MKRSLTNIVAASAVITLSLLVGAPASARAAWDTAPVHVTRQVAPVPHILDLRVGQHPTYDRVVIDLSGPIPGYDLRYVSDLHYDATGGTVPLSGARFIQLRLTPAVAHDAQGHSLYHGPQLQQYAMPTLRGAAFTGDFEGRVSFGLALSHRKGFRVFELSAPNRIVIDLHH